MSRTGRRPRRGKIRFQYQPFSACCAFQSTSDGLVPNRLPGEMLQ
ncbi:hypothetical protein SC1_02188 [Sphingopyxis sp. C-1]|nr:hypothetical protein SC1_02188 [Sphingopyxis sp. C-1]